MREQIAPDALPAWLAAAVMRRGVHGTALKRGGLGCLDFFRVIFFRESFPCCKLRHCLVQLKTKRLFVVAAMPSPTAVEFDQVRPSTLGEPLPFARDVASGEPVG